MTQSKAFKRAVRDRMSRTGESYTAARMHVPVKKVQPRVAVTNGDSVAGTLREGGLADIVIAWQDVLHDCPVPSLPPARLRKVRAAHLSSSQLVDRSLIEGQLSARDAALRRYAGQELTLWFEADLYDQLQLIQILSRLRDITKPRRCA